MSHFMRKHRRGILVGLIIFIGIPFVLWAPGVGMPFGGNPQMPGMPEVVAKVGSEPVTTVEFLTEYNRVSRARAQSGTFPTAQELTQDGTVEQILESLINSKLLTAATEKQGFKATQDYLEEMLREMPEFQTADGNFDAAYYNQWVEGNSGANWEEIYNQLNSSLNRQIFGSLVTAGVRVFDEDIRKQYLDANTKLRIKHTAIEPKVELTDEQIRAHFDENPELYKTEEERVAEFVSVSLEAPLPPIVDTILTQAYGGADFSALAQEHSEGADKTSGGDMGWISETAGLPEHQKVLFTMKVGDVSDPVRGPNGVHIYKVTGERDSTLAGRRDVRAQQIVLRPQLSEEEKQARVDQAQAVIDAAAAKDGALAAAAADAGMEIQSTDPFTRTSTSIRYVDQFDTFAFRQAALELAPGQLSSVIEGRNNLYVAKIATLVEPQDQPFETVQERVETDAIAAHKRTPEYQERVAQYVQDIEAKAKTLAEIEENFPELDLTIAETPTAFSTEDFLFQQGVRFQARDAFDALDGRSAGEMAGPITDFFGVTYFVELIERIEPDETMWAEQWPTERETLSTQARMMQQFEHQQDYFQYLREKAEGDFLIQEDWAAIAQAIDMGGTDTTPEETPPAETTPAETTPVGDAEPVEAAPAESTDPSETPAEVESDADIESDETPAAESASPSEAAPEPSPNPESGTPEE